MRMLRWAVELANSSDEDTADMGLALLDVLITSKLVRRIDRPLAEAVGLAVQNRQTTVSFGYYDETDYNTSDAKIKENNND